MKNKLASALLSAGAVHLRPEQPFTFASGIRSPVYCDNRVLLGNVEARRLMSMAFAAHAGNAEVLAGPATGGIAWAAWVAELLSLPMAYVRSSAKGHGRIQQIEAQISKAAMCLCLKIQSALAKVPSTPSKPCVPPMPLLSAAYASLPGAGKPHDSAL